MDKILLMLQLQKELNDSTNGENWTDGITKNGKKIDWNRCIYMECAEIIDSFAWKHWKNIDKEPDYNNLKIEVVDIWHFVLSLAIENYTKNMLGSIEVLAQDISQMQNFQKIDNNDEKFSDIETIMSQVEKIIAISLDRDNLKIDVLINKFFDLVTMSGLNLSELYKLYVGKNILNQFRQDHGYKDGSYIKVWNGEEDNVVMMRIWQENPNIDPDGLYKELTKQYIALNR